MNSLAPVSQPLISSLQPLVNENKRQRRPLAIKSRSFERNPYEVDVRLNGGLLARLRIRNAAGWELKIYGETVLCIPNNDYTVSFRRIFEDIHRAELALRKAQPGALPYPPRWQSLLMLVNDINPAELPSRPKHPQWTTLNTERLYPGTIRLAYTVNARSFAPDRIVISPEYVVQSPTKAPTFRASV